MLEIFLKHLCGVNNGVRKCCERGMEGGNFKLYVFVVWKLLEDNDGKCARQGKEKDILETTTNNNKNCFCMPGRQREFYISGTERMNGNFQEHNTIFLAIVNGEKWEGTTKKNNRWI